MIRGTYSPEGDALGIDFEGVRGRGAVRTVEIAPDVHADFDEEGRLLGLEVLHASRQYPEKWLRSLGDPSTWLTLKEAAAESAEQGEPISPEQLRWLLNEKKLEGRKVGRDWQVAVHVLWNYLENRPTVGRPVKHLAPSGTTGHFQDGVSGARQAATNIKEGSTGMKHAGDSTQVRLKRGAESKRMEQAGPKGARGKPKAKR